MFQLKKGSMKWCTLNILQYFIKKNNSKLKKTSQFTN